MAQVTPSNEIRVVTYEMVTGKRAFVAADISNTRVSVLRDEPDAISFLGR